MRRGLNNQANQENISAESPTPIQTRDILDTPINSPRSAEIINQEMINTPANSIKYTKLLQELQTAISTPPSTEAKPQQPPEPLPTKPTTPETNIDQIKNLAAKIDPKYSGDIDILGTKLKERGLNSSILNSIIRPVSELSNNTITELSQTTAEKNTQKSGEVGVFARSVLLRLISTDNQSENTKTNIVTLAELHQIPLNTNPETQITHLESTFVQTDTGTTEAELTYLDSKINKTGTDLDILKKQQEETLTVNRDLEKQLTSSKVQVKEKQAEFDKNTTELPSNKNKLAA